jgi:rhodanese-related sulfurtransferase
VDWDDYFAFRTAAKSDSQLGLFAEPFLDAIRITMVQVVKHKMKPWYQAGILYGILPLVFGSFTLLLPTRASWNPPGIEEGYIELETVLSLESEPVWLDARTREEFESGSIPGAIWMDATEFEPQLQTLMERWVPGMEIVVFCGSAACDASQRVAERLRNEVGLPDVWVLTGGWESWKRGNH